MFTSFFIGFYSLNLVWASFFEFWERVSDKINQGLTLYIYTEGIIKKSVMRKIKKLGTSGSAAVEFAIVLPVALFLFLSIIEYSLIFLVNSAMETSMANLSRYAKVELVKAKEGGDVSYTTFKNNFVKYVEANSGIINANRLVLTTDTVSSSLNVDKTEYCVKTDTGERGQPCSKIGDVCPLGYYHDDYNRNNTCESGAQVLLPGEPGEVVTYRLVYTWNLMSPILNATIGDKEGQYIIQTFGVLRNER